MVEIEKKLNGEDLNSNETYMNEGELLNWNLD